MKFHKIFTLKYKSKDGTPQFIDVVAVDLAAAQQAADNYFAELYGAVLMTLDSCIGERECLVDGDVVDLSQYMSAIEEKRQGLAEKRDLAIAIVEKALAQTDVADEVRLALNRVHIKIHQDFLPEFNRLDHEADVIRELVLEANQQ